jgi:hypothetical protein
MYCRPQLDAGRAELSLYGAHGDTNVGADLSQGPAIAVETDGASDIPAADRNRHDLQSRMIGQRNGPLEQLAVFDEVAGACCHRPSRIRSLGLAIAADPCASLEPLRESAGVLDLDDYLPALAAAVAAPKCRQRFGEREDRVDVHAQLVCIGQPSHLG